jgi:hypothetical protein
LEESFLREVPEVLGQAASPPERERDREAWNLPRKPSDVDAPTTGTPVDEVAANGHPTAAHGVIQGLPENVGVLDRHELRKASDTRDERLSILFRRWPSLSKIELKEIRQLYDERQHLARCIGLLRNGRHAESAEAWRH